MKKHQLVILFQQMADLTASKCGSTCTQRVTQLATRCCDSMYCNIAKKYAKEEWNVELRGTGHKTLPFMGEKGCIVAPHLRPLCTLHVCGINDFGTTLDPKFDRKYFELREKINDASY